jgi:hypothetical protein
VASAAAVYYLADGGPIVAHLAPRSTPLAVVEGETEPSRTSSMCAIDARIVKKIS